MLLENPSTYLAFAESTYSEIDFIAEIVHRTGAGSCSTSTTSMSRRPISNGIRSAISTNIRLPPSTRFISPATRRKRDEKGRHRTVDTHDRPVDAVVWELYEHTIARLGPVPTLIEWDANVPAWPELKAEAERAEAIMFAAGRKDNAHAISG